MTTREFYTAIATATTIDTDYMHATHDDLVTKANELIEGLDHKNALRKDKPSKDSIAAAERRNAVLGFLKEHAGEFLTRDEIATALEISGGQATSACTALVKEAAISKKEVKVEKAKKVAYRFSAE